MLKDCKNGECFEGILLVNEWEEVSFRQKPRAYLSLICQDRSGMIQGKMWDYKPQVLTLLKDQDVFYVKGVACPSAGNQEPCPLAWYSQKRLATRRRQKGCFPQISGLSRESMRA